MEDAGQVGSLSNFMTAAPISGIVKGEEAPAMNVILSLNPEIEKGLMAHAHARGVSLDDYLQELVAKGAGLPSGAELRPAQPRFENLSDLLLNSPFAGADLDLERAKDYPRPVDLG
jgi:hypothetical protein